jgi:hypothetical protein
MNDLIEYCSDLHCIKCGHKELLYRYIEPLINRCEVVEREEKIIIKCKRCEWTAGMKVKEQ